MRIFENIKDLFNINLKPKNLEERFRLESLPRDKNQTIIVMICTLIIVLGFLGLEIFSFNNTEIYPYLIPSRIVASIASLIAIRFIHRQSNANFINQVTFAWWLVIILHMFVIHLTRPQDYISVIIWDILTISGIYFLPLLPSQYNILLAFLLTGSSGAIWVINKIPLVDSYEAAAVLAAYFYSNVYGICVSIRHDRARRRQYVLLFEEIKSRRKLTDRTIELEKTQEQLRFFAMTDHLTGISNRRHFLSQISEEFERTRRYSEPFSLMVIDIDNFKVVNDTYGHNAGDEVL